MHRENLPGRYLSKKSVADIGGTIARTWAHNGRRGTGPLLEAARQDNTLSEIVRELDTAVDRLNNNWLPNSAIETSGYWNIRALRRFLEGQRELPKIRQEPGCGLGEWRGFIQALRSMSPLMQSYEIDGNAETGLTFGVKAAEAARTADDRGLYQALVDGTFQVAGRLLAIQLGKDPDLSVTVERGAGRYRGVELKTLIMDTLLEVPVLEVDLYDFGFYRAAREMNWYQSGGPFSWHV